MYQEGETARVLDAKTFLLPVRNLRVRKPFALSQDRTVGEALSLMREKRIGCVLVTRNAKLVGIFSERDVLFKIAGQPQMEQRSLQEVMTSRVESLHAEDSIAFALNAMHVGGYRHVPIVDAQQRPLAVVSMKDIMAFIVEHFPQELLNLPPKPMRTTGQREGA